MHPLEVYVCYTLLALALTIYLSRSKNSGLTIKSGDSLRVATPVLIGSGIIFLGLPAGLVVSLPGAANPTAALAATLIVTFLFTLLFCVLVAVRLIITDEGLELRLLNWRESMEFKDYDHIVIRRYNLVFIPAHNGTKAFHIPAVFQNITALHDYSTARLMRFRKARQEIGTTNDRKLSEAG